MLKQTLISMLLIGGGVFPVGGYAYNCPDGSLPSNGCVADAWSTSWIGDGPNGYDVYDVCEMDCICGDYCEVDGTIAFQEGWTEKQWAFYGVCNPDVTNEKVDDCNSFADAQRGQ